MGSNVVLRLVSTLASISSCNYPFSVCNVGWFGIQLMYSALLFELRGEKMQEFWSRALSDVIIGVLFACRCFTRLNLGLTRNLVCCILIFSKFLLSRALWSIWGAKKDGRKFSVFSRTCIDDLPPFLSCENWSAAVGKFCSVVCIVILNVCISFEGGHEDVTVADSLSSELYSVVMLSSKDFMSLIIITCYL